MSDWTLNASRTCSEDECEEVSPCDVLVHGRGSIEEVLEVLHDIAHTCRREAETPAAGGPPRKVANRDEFDRLARRLHAGQAKVVLRKLFLYKQGTCSVMQEIWIQDKNNPDASSEPLKEYAVVHVHHHWHEKVHDCADIDICRHLESVDAINVRHILGSRGKAFACHGKNPFRDTWIEPSGNTLFPPEKWQCKKCGWSNAPNKMQCVRAITAAATASKGGGATKGGASKGGTAAKGGAARGSPACASAPAVRKCDGRQECTNWEWRCDEGRDPHFHFILAEAAKLDEFWDSRSGKDRHRAAGAKAKPSTLEALMSMYEASERTRAPRKDLRNVEEDDRRSAARPLPCQACQHSPCLHTCTAWKGLDVAMLCIGISKYSPMISLPNAARDARTLHDKLNELGPHCKAEVREDVQTNEDLLKCIRHFLQRKELQKSPPRGVLIEYSGHGIQKDGNVYLLPGNSNPEDPTFDPNYNAFSLGDILRFCRADLDDLAARETRKKVSFVVIIDACRDSAALSDSAVYGSLDQHKNRNPTDWAIYFSCSRDSTANDGPSGGHSPFVAELLHDTEGIFAQGVPLGKGLNDACDRLRRQQSDQFALGIAVHTIPADLYLFPPDSDASSIAGIKEAVATDSDYNELVRFLNGKGLSAIAAQFSHVMGMDLAEDLGRLQAEDLDDPEFSFLWRWQKQKLMELVQGITAGSASLRGSDLNASDVLSGADTASEAGDTALESGDDEDLSFATVLAKHPGDPADFPEHMAGFLRDFLACMEAGVEADDEWNTYDVDLGNTGTRRWTWCMLLWIQFAQDASKQLDESLLSNWLEACNNRPSQGRFLELLNLCLLSSTTPGNLWSRDTFESLECKKQHAASIFVTDAMVQRCLERHPEIQQMWSNQVVGSWFCDDDETADDFLLRANRFLRDHIHHSMCILQGPEKTQSYIAFMRMTPLASLLLFKYLEARKWDDTASSGPAVGMSSLFHGFCMFVSSSRGIFSLTPADAPALGARSTVLQGLRCLARLSAQAWELLGPMKTARAYVEEEAQAVEENAGICLKAKDLDPDDDESGAAATSADSGRKPNILSDGVARGLIQDYLTELSKTVGHYVDSASGEERKVDGESIPLVLHSGQSFDAALSAHDAALQESLTCPISHQIMQDPVKCSDGKTYERAAIENWCRRQSTSPLTRETLEADDNDKSRPRLEADKEILAKIQEFKREKAEEEDRLKRDAEGEEENQILRIRYGVQNRKSTEEEQRMQDSRREHGRDSCLDTKDGKVSKEKYFKSASQFLHCITDPQSATSCACLTGPPASGKTVTMFQIVHAAVGLCKRKMEGGELLVPVFMRASELSKLLSEARATNELLNLLSLPGDKGEGLRHLIILFLGHYVHQKRYAPGVVEALAELFDLNLLLVCIDGLDEAAAHRELVENSIDQAVRSKRSLRVLISTREHSYAHSRACFRLGEFEVVKLQPLTSERQMDMIKGRIPEQASNFKQQLDVRALQNPELATSPFLLSLMIEVYKKKGNLPARRVDLYREQVEGIVSRCVARHVTNKQESPEGYMLALMEQEMQRAAVNMNLEYAMRLHDAIGVLRRGQDSVHAAGASGSVETALNLAIEYLEVCSFVCQMLREERDFKLAACAQELQQRWIHGVGLLAVTRTLLFEDGLVGLLSLVDDETYRFSHLTLQEYLAARCTVRLFQHDVAELVKHLEPLHSRWRREVLQFTACMLEEDAVFTKFCQTVLQRDDGSGANCELVRAFVSERGDSEEVEQMLADAILRLRGDDNLVAGLCHPSPDVRELLLSEMRQFQMPPEPFAGGGLVSALKKIAQDTSAAWYRRRAGILSLAQIAQMEHCNRGTWTGRADTLKWMLQMLNEDNAVRENIHFALIKGLGTMLSRSDQRDEERPCMVLNDADERVLLEMLCQMDKLAVAEAIADLELFSDGLMDWLLGDLGSFLINAGKWPLRHVSLLCDKVAAFFRDCKGAPGELAEGGNSLASSDRSLPLVEGRETGFMAMSPQGNWLRRASKLTSALLGRMLSDSCESVEQEKTIKQIAKLRASGADFAVLELLRTGDAVRRLRVLEACAEADIFFARENISNLALCLLEENAPTVPDTMSSNKEKRSQCKFFQRGNCKFGKKCRYAHGTDQLESKLSKEGTQSHGKTRSLLTRLLQAETEKQQARGMSNSKPEVCRVSRNVPGYLHEILKPHTGDDGPVDRALELLAQCQRMEQKQETFSSQSVVVDADSDWAVDDSDADLQQAIGNSLGGGGARLKDKRAALVGAPKLLRPAAGTETGELMQREVSGSHEMPGTIRASNDNQPCASPANTHQFHEEQVAHGCDSGPHGARVLPGTESEHSPSFRSILANYYKQKDMCGSRSIITAGASVGSEGNEICSAGEDAEHNVIVIDDSVLAGECSPTVVVPKRSQRIPVQGMDDSRVRERLEELEARMAEIYAAKSPALHDPGSGPAPYMCVKLWQASQLVEQMTLPTAAADKAKTAYPLVCFLVDREDLGDGARDNRQFAQQVMELVQCKTLGRMLFSAILHHVRAQFQEYPVAAAHRLQTLADLIGVWPAVGAEEHVERQLLLKELRIGRRAMELVAWSGEVSVSQGGDTGGLFHESMRLLLEGNNEVVANVSVVKADLSEHKTLLEVPAELRRFKEHVHALKVASHRLKALPEWMGEMRNLQKLDLASCSWLTALPESMGSLTRLQELDLYRCKTLTALPESMGSLTRLQELDLSYCSGLTTLPEWMGSLTGLQKLDLRHCSGLTTLPESMGRLTGLQELSLFSCSGLTSLPESMGRLTGLQKLDPSHCSGLTALPESMGSLTGLQELSLSGCKRLTSLPESMGSLTRLQELSLSGCERLTSLPEWMGRLTGLQKLSLSSCSGLKTLPEWMGSLTRLQELSLSFCSWLTALPEWMGRLTGLQELSLFSCSGLTALPESMGRLTGLQELSLYSCSGLTALPEWMGRLTGLQKLDLSHCSGLTALPESMGSLTRLQELSLSGCKRLTSLPESMDRLTGLQKLSLSSCSGLKTLPEWMGSLTRLQELDLYSCSGLTALPESMGSLTRLQKLSLSSCSGLTALPESMGRLTGLQELDLYSCSGLTALPESMGSLTRLQKLSLSSCSGLTALPESMGRLTGLHKLSLYSCSGSKTLPEWMGRLTGRLTGLHKLYLYSCSELTALPEWMCRLTGLQELDLHSCSVLTALPESMGSLTRLQKLSMSSCSGLTALPESMGRLTGLQELDLSFCSGLTSLPESMDRLTGLQKLSLTCCSGLKTLPESMGRLTGLQELSLYSCSGLTALPVVKDLRVSGVKVKG